VGREESEVLEKESKSCIPGARSASCTGVACADGGFSEVEESDF